MERNLTYFKTFILSILLTVVFVSCGSKKTNQLLTVRYNEQGIIVSAITEDQAPLNQAQEAYKAGERLLQTHWSQSSPFNQQLPAIHEILPPVGCANTAIAQVLYYFKHDIKPLGIFKGQLYKDEAWADFNTPIHWNYIRANPSEHKKQIQNDELAFLFKRLAVVNKTSLASAIGGGSGTSDQNLVHSIKHYLGFSSKLEVLSAKADQIKISSIQNKIITSINAKIPVLLTTQGSLAHALVVDGYKEIDGEILFHLNFGWGGLHNGFYNLNQAISVKEEFTKTDGSRWERILESSEYSFYFNLKPCRDDCQQFNEDQDLKIDKTMTGELDQVFDEDYFGPFSPSKQVDINLGSWEKPYFITIVNQYGEVIAERNSSFSFESAFPYRIRISPKSLVSGSYYNRSSNYQFTIDSKPSELSRSHQKIELSLNTQALSLNHSDTIRVLSSSYIPDGLSLTIEGDSIDENFYKTDRNLLIFNPDFFIKDKVYALNVLFKVNGIVVQSQSLEVIHTSKNLSLGPKQTLKGKFSSQHEEIIFQSVLKGTCSIKGHSGYSNQGFFIDFNQNGFTETEQEFQHLDLNIYTLRASLSHNRESYLLNPAKSDFNINVECTDANYSFSDITQIL